jgi:hypothetical protein
MSGRRLSVKVPVMDPVHELPDLDRLDQRDRDILAPLQLRGQLCLDLEHALRTAHLLEDGARLNAARLPAKPLDLVCSAAVDYHDTVLRAYLQGVMAYTDLAARLWEQGGTHHQAQQSVADAGPVDLRIEPIRRLLTDKPAMPEPRTDCRPEIFELLDTLARQFAMDGVPADSALDEIEDVDGRGIRMLAVKLHDYGQECHWSLRFALEDLHSTAHTRDR